MSITIIELKHVTQSAYSLDSLIDEGIIDTRIEAVTDDSLDGIILDSWHLKGLGSRVTAIYSDVNLKKLYNSDRDLYIHNCDGIFIKEDNKYIYKSIVCCNLITKATLTILKNYIDDPIEVWSFTSLIRTLNHWSL